MGDGRRLELPFAFGGLQLSGQMVEVLGQFAQLPSFAVFGHPHAQFTARHRPDGPAQPFERPHESPGHQHRQQQTRQGRDRQGGVEGRPEQPLKGPPGAGQLSPERLLKHRPASRGQVAQHVRGRHGQERCLQGSGDQDGQNE